MRVLLVNTNRLQPPIAPVALDYLAAALRAAGHEPALLDLCSEPDPEAAMSRALAGEEYGLIGLTFRNTDDCYYPGRAWFVPELAALVSLARQHSAAPLVLGGVGFSIMPEAIMRQTGADWGIAGDGEFALVRLANGEREIPGALHQREGMLRRQPAVPDDLSALPAMRRDFVDNVKYERLGGQIGFETKRGCAAPCVYCADPVAKGRAARLRPPAAVADELESLADRGIAHLHTCDAEFNRPGEHALAVCEALIRRGLGEKLRWHAYCAPVPFSADLARALRRAGCVGINFGVDHGVESMLRLLGRDYRPADLESAFALCRQNGLATMADLLLGGPGETESTLRAGLDFIRQIRPDRVGLSVGIRVYPGTPLARRAQSQPEALRGPGAAAGDFVAPTYYLSPALGERIFSLVRELTGDDPRFFFSDPTEPDRNYNYSGNDLLVKALAAGYRGAYWDILRRWRENLPPP